MASWKKVLTEEDNTNIANTDLTTPSGSVTRSLTLGTGSTFNIESNNGTAFMQCLETSGLANTINFNALIYNVNCIVSCKQGLANTTGTIAIYDSSSNFVRIKGPTTFNAITNYELPQRPTRANPLMRGGAAAQESSFDFINEIAWDDTNDHLELHSALTKPIGAGGGRSGNLLDVTEVDDAPDKCIGDFVNLDGLSSATFATNRVFAFTGTAAPLADADNESDATRMLLFNNIAQSSSTTLKALRKGMAIIPEADVEGTAASGAIMYLHPSGGTAGDEGKMTFTRPTASGKFVRHVGYCIKTVTISTVDYVVFLFDPSSDFIEIG